MPDNLTSGNFKIVSLIEGNPPASVGPPYIGLQFVHLNGVDKIWRVVKDGEKAYLLAIDGYRSTLATGDKVAASIEPGQNVQWIATYRDHRDAYTIEPVNGGDKVWTVPFGSDGDSKAVIEITGIISPQDAGDGILFSIYQLFKFVPADE